MNTVGFQTKLCKPRHPYTKGKVERLIRFIKDNFVEGRQFLNLTDINAQALEWCEKQNNRYHKEIDDIPSYLHTSACQRFAAPLRESAELLNYLCPLRKISFDGFVNYEGRRFGVPYSYAGQTVRIRRKNELLYVYSPDLRQTLVTHQIDWSKREQYCRNQFLYRSVPEEFASVPVTTSLRMLSSPPRTSVGFEKFNFEEDHDE
jgi:hypothetical protein